MSILEPYTLHNDMLARMLHNIHTVSYNTQRQYTQQRQAVTSVSNRVLSKTRFEYPGVSWGVCPPPLEDTTPKADPLAPPGTLAASASASCSILLAAWTCASKQGEPLKAEHNMLFNQCHLALICMWKCKHCTCAS